jgi:glutathione S-transferase
MSELTLWVDAFWISPYAFSAFVALEEKGLDYAVEIVALHENAQRRPEYAERSLTARVPMLRHGDFHLSESSAIVEYLDDAFPGTPRMLPTDVRQRARARQLMAWIRSDLMPIREERSTHTLFYQRARNPLSPGAEAAVRRLLSAAEAVVPEGGTLLFGSFTAADADLALMLQRLRIGGHPLTSRLTRFVDLVWNRPSVRKFTERSRPSYVPY